MPTGGWDPESLSNLVAAYQSVTPLKLGELWAIPIMLRLGLIENLRRVVVRIAVARSARNDAVYWAEKMTKIVELEPENLILAIADMARSNPPLASPFVAELSRCLHGHGPALALALSWIEQRLSDASFDHRTISPFGKPAAGVKSGGDEQQHRQSPGSGHHELAGIRRKNERGRTNLD